MASWQEFLGLPPSGIANRTVGKAVNAFNQMGADTGKYLYEHHQKMKSDFKDPFPSGSMNKMRDSIAFERGELEGPIQNKLGSTNPAEWEEILYSLMDVMPMGGVAGTIARAKGPALKQAQYMKEVGFGPEDIYKKTMLDHKRGVQLEGHPSGVPVYEFSDAGARLTDMGKNPGGTGFFPLNQALEHEELYKEYPAMRNHLYQRKPDPGGAQGSFDPGSELINVSPTAKDPLATAIHEGGHGVARQGGLPSGSSPGQFREIGLSQAVQAGKNVKAYENTRPLLQFLHSKGVHDRVDLTDDIIEKARSFYGDNALITLDTATNGEYTKKALQAGIESQRAKMDWAGSEYNAFDMYHRTSGEADARLAAGPRSKLTSEELAQRPFFSEPIGSKYGYDVAPDQQIVRYGDGPSASLPTGEANRIAKIVNSDVSDPSTYYGLRAIPKEYGKVKEGDELANSYLWDFANDMPSEKQASGVSSIGLGFANDGIDIGDVEAALRAVKKYDGDIVLVKGKHGDYGDGDQFEVLIENPTVANVLKADSLPMDEASRSATWQQILGVDDGQ